MTTLRGLTNQQHPSDANAASNVSAASHSTWSLPEEYDDEVIRGTAIVTEGKDPFVVVVELTITNGGISGKMTRNGEPYDLAGRPMDLTVTTNDGRKLRGIYDPTTRNFAAAVDLDSGSASWAHNENSDVFYGTVVVGGEAVEVELILSQGAEGQGTYAQIVRGGERLAYANKGTDHIVELWLGNTRFAGTYNEHGQHIEFDIQTQFQLQNGATLEVARNTASNTFGLGYANRGPCIVLNQESGECSIYESVDFDYTKSDSDHGKVHRIEGTATILHNGAPLDVDVVLSAMPDGAALAAKFVHNGTEVALIGDTNSPIVLSINKPDGRKFKGWFDPTTQQFNLAAETFVRVGNGRLDIFGDTGSDSFGARYGFDASTQYDEQLAQLIEAGEPIPEDLAPPPMHIVELTYQQTTGESGITRLASGRYIIDGLQLEAQYNGSPNSPGAYAFRVISDGREVAEEGESAAIANFGLASTVAPDAGGESSRSYLVDGSLATERARLGATYTQTAGKGSDYTLDAAAGGARAESTDDTGNVVVTEQAGVAANLAATSGDNGRSYQSSGSAWTQDRRYQVEGQYSQAPQRRSNYSGSLLVPVGQLNLSRSSNRLEDGAEDIVYNGGGQLTAGRVGIAGSYQQSSLSPHSVYNISITSTQPAAEKNADSGEGADASLTSSLSYGRTNSAEGLLLHQAAANLASPALTVDAKLTALQGQPTLFRVAMKDGPGNTFAFGSSGTLLDVIANTSDGKSFRGSFDPTTHLLAAAVQSDNLSLEYGQSNERTSARVQFSLPQENHLAVELASKHGSADQQAGYLLALEAKDDGTLLRYLTDFNMTKFGAELENGSTLYGTLTPDGHIIVQGQGQNEWQRQDATVTLGGGLHVGAPVANPFVDVALGYGIANDFSAKLTYNLRRADGDSDFTRQMRLSVTDFVSEEVVSSFEAGYSNGAFDLFGASFEAAYGENFKLSSAYQMVMAPDKAEWERKYNVAALYTWANMQFELSANPEAQSYTHRYIAPNKRYSLDSNFSRNAGGPASWGVGASYSGRNGLRAGLRFTDDAGTKSLVVNASLKL